MGNKNGTSEIKPAVSLDEAGIGDILHKKLSIPDDLSIEPNPDLVGYQDDLGSGDKEDAVAIEIGDHPADYLGVPEEVLADELEKLAIDEMPSTSDEETDEDSREHIEDTDENDRV